MRTHYDNLKVAQNAPDFVIKASYKALIQKYHPDKFKDEKEQQEALRITKIIVNSFDVLSDPIKRAEHDEWIKNCKNDSNNFDETIDSETFSNDDDQNESKYDDLNLTMKCGICGEKSFVKAPHCVYCFANFEEAESNTFGFWFAKISFILRSYVAFWGIFFLLFLIAKFNLSPKIYSEIEPFITPRPIFLWLPMSFIILTCIDLKLKVYAVRENTDKAACEIYMLYPILHTALHIVGILFIVNYFFHPQASFGVRYWFNSNSSFSSKVDGFSSVYKRKIDKVIKANNVIEFKDYPVSQIYTGNAAKVILATEQDRYFRTRLRETRDIPVNFAGEYVFNSWGCGTGCSFGAAVSHRTGKVVFFPYQNYIGVATCEGQYHNEDDGYFNFYENSRLMKVFGTDELFGGDDGTKEIRFFEFTGKEFRLIKRFSLKCR